MLIDHRSFFTRLFILAAFSFPLITEAQDASLITMPASTKYQRSAAYQRKWGQHYRAEWATPVTFHRAYLDTLAGGLTPYQTGGGRQSKSLRLRDKNGREYVLRSIDKSFGRALPDIAQNTFIEDLVDDQVTIGHPYSALVVSALSEAAGIYHTNPVVLYVPKQPALGKYNDSTGNILYLFEQRPDENWEIAPNFGNSKKIISTEKMLENILEDNDRSVDQKAFLRARLFDMLIGDWGRHDDQWRWASFKDDKQTIYKPIPRDRDQAFTKFDGNLLKLAIGFSGAKHLQTFDNDLKDVTHFNFPARHLDHHLLNELTLEDWVSIANDLKQRLTDPVIDRAVHQFPPEVYPISGPEIAAKLKSRRDQLEKYAREYHAFLSKEVDITGSEDTELFDVERTGDGHTEVNIYKITNEGKQKSKPFYHRVFDNSETSEIRLYGLKGSDKYRVHGNGSGPKLRLIGGTDKDEFVTEAGGGHTYIYDDHDNVINKKGHTSVHLRNDSAIHAYKYDAFEYDKSGIKPIASYNSEDRFYVGLAWAATKQQWRREPYGKKYYLDVKYSISQKAFSSTFKSSFRELIGRWDVNPLLNFDAVRWTNFYGLGNNTSLQTTDRDFNRMRTREFHANIGLERVIHNQHRITLTPFYQYLKIINDTARYLAKDGQYINHSSYYDPKHFAGAELTYVFQMINDSVLPTKGLSFMLNGSHYSGINNSDASFQKYGAELNLMTMFTRNLGVLVRAGGATLTGHPEFYQYNSIGGSHTLRGYQRNRFYGNQTFFNQNELRWISNVRSYIFNGKIGLFALYDVGRVWLDGESSNLWHSAYGAGLYISPFNKITLSLAYGISPEDKNFHFNIVKPF